MIYSVEYCHVYTDKGIDDLAETSISVLRDIVKDLKDEKIQLSVMVDDYSPKHENGFNYADLIEFLNVRDAMPSVIINESALLDTNLKVLELMPEGKLKRSYQTYINGTGYHPCSLFVASWYLVRLGKIMPPVKLQTIHLEEFRFADRLINILPVHFLEAENKAAKILRALEIPVSKIITNIYIEDRNKPLGTVLS